jgi:hypothetical protein
MTIYSIYYMKPEHFRDGICGRNQPTAATIHQTHTFLRAVQAESLDEVYSIQQADHWARDHVATNAMLESKGLQHTSMSVGDVIYEQHPNGGGAFYIVASFGFDRIG